MSDEIVISARNLSKCYQIYGQPIDRLKQSIWRSRKKFFREFWALRDASFEIRKGETVGIVGSNGSGKSTLLQMICGILNPTAGEFHVNGRVAALLELGAGFNPEFSGRENVFMNAAIMGLSKPETESCYDDIVTFAGIGDFIEQPVKTYSSGMYVRLAFATAINVSPDILVVDEALSVGDIRFQQKCMAKIKSFCENGTVIFVSHDTGAVTELCSRAIWIEKGEIRMDGEPKSVVESYHQYMYEGDINGTDAVEPDSPLKDSPDGDNGDADTEAGFLQVSDDVRQFGNHNVTIEKVRISSGANCNGVIRSAEPCEIGLIFTARRDIASPIIGFLIKDRLGRDIIGDNTALIGQNMSRMAGGRRYRVDFRLEMWPNLCEGDYTLSIAIADGTVEDHEQCHWLYDAVAFKSTPVKVPAGLFSVLNTDVRISQTKV
ncbi:ABC transporter ATP-binding protein [Desulfonema ishimotonii]|uniref:ABC transporter ATP-binding protein n=1 Tax=Desulfonema ishimotonii TaxID=45657 RepID=A0A401FUM9_9BACT|nr:ABC transporter ATP-binding protein [Desulfonema ishimotonii]GBC60663.1 ABC transporter ATP-binding protein [Desulfonema ishimotonii]